MKELSLHILDLIQNSITANATLITIDIVEDCATDRLTISIADNGKGMSADFLKRVRDPFTTTRTTRPVGMGISLFESAAVACDGSLDVQSALGEGTTITATFRRSHIDRAPIGDMGETMVSLLLTNPDIDFVYNHRVDEKKLCLDTRQLREVMGDVPLSSIDVLQWIKDYIDEQTTIILGGEL